MSVYLLEVQMDDGTWQPVFSQPHYGEFGWDNVLEDLRQTQKSVPTAAYRIAVYKRCAAVVKEVKRVQ